VEIITNILSAFGLSSSAGLNAYLPLLIVALTARFTNWLTLRSPWDTLESPWVIGTLLVLLLIEFFADKTPAINHVNDVVQTFVRPAAGAILFAASTDVVSDVDPVVALILGLLTAGTVHAAKSVVVRPAVTATTGGAANPIVGLAEDFTAISVSLVAILLPVILLAAMIVVIAVFLWWLWRRSVRASPA
jgi:precorrin-3B methylase